MNNGIIPYKNKIKPIFIDSDKSVRCIDCIYFSSFEGYYNDSCDESDWFCVEYCPLRKIRLKDPFNKICCDQFVAQDKHINCENCKFCVRDYSSYQCQKRNLIETTSHYRCSEFKYRNENNPVSNEEICTFLCGLIIVTTFVCLCAFC